MKVIRVGRRCLLAFLVLGAFAATTASAAEYELHALPELGKCVKVETGKGIYKGGQCIVRETGTVGKWEWVPASVSENVTFEGGATSVKLASTGHETIGCVVGNVKGTLTGPKTVSAELELQGCANAKGELCGSPGNENLIKSNPLEGTLGFIKNEIVNEHTHVKVGMLFKAVSPLPIASYHCGGTLFEPPNTSLEGSVIASDKPIDAMKLDNKLNFHVTVKGTQDPEKFQGEPKATLSTTFKSGLEETTVPSTFGMKEYSGKYSIPMEIKAIER